MEESSKAMYDFNAPQHYFNFNEGVVEEPDDSYFECNETVDSNKETSQVAAAIQNVGTPKRPPLADVTPKKTQMKVSTPNKPQVTVGTPNKSQKTVESNKPQLTAGTSKRNPFTNATPQKAPTLIKMEVPASENEEEKENAPQVPTQSRSTHATPKTSIHLKSTSAKKKKESISPRVGIRSSPRLSAIAKALRKSNAARRSTGSGSRRSSDINNTNLSIVQKQKTQNKPSLPRVSGMTKGLSNKDRSDLAEIATFKLKMAKNKKKTESSSASSRIQPTVPLEFHFATDTRLRQKNPPNQAGVPTAAAPVKATRLGSTKPQEFNFATDGRIKKQPSVESEEPVSFPECLRQSGSNLDKDVQRGRTIPQPFKFTESRKTGVNTELNKFVSVAELNLKFHTQTPQRFRSKRADDSDDAYSTKKSKANSKVTIPVTPELSTRTRSRPVNYLTREEMEEKELEKEQKHKFKANPINKKIFEAPAHNLQAERKQSTIPEPFNITKSKKEETPFGNNFKEMCNKLGCSTSSLASLPWGGVPSIWEKTNTKIQPFSFDVRDKEKQQRKQEMIQKILEEEKKLAEFHAQPMPIFETGIRGVPEKKPPTPTRLEPFNLQSDLRGEKIRDQFQKGLEAEERLDKERRKFKATSDAVVHKQPFIPEKSKRPTTDISGFTLNTEVRAEARTEFDLYQKQREDQLSAAKLEREERLAAEEAAEIAKMRREAVQKANPVRHYKPLEIQPAPCPPTVPVSPNFATKSRLRSRLNNITSSANSTMDMSSATYTAE